MSLIKVSRRHQGEVKKWNFPHDEDISIQCHDIIFIVWDVSFIGITKDCMYRQVSNIRRTLVGNKIVDHSDVVGASPVGAAPTTSSISTEHLAWLDRAKTTARRDEKHLCLGFGASYIRDFTVYETNICPTYCRWHFEVHFHEWKLLCFETNFTYVCSEVSIGAGNDMAPNSMPEKFSFHIVII